MERDNFAKEAWNENMLAQMFGNDVFYIYGAVDKGNILGYCAFYIIEQEGNIANIVVDKPYRRQGLGRQMMDFMTALFKKKGVKTVFLEVNTANASAIKMYRAYGYEILSVRKNYYSQGNEHNCRDAYSMAKNL